MANTFEFIIDRKDQFSLQNKMTIMSDYYNFIHRKGTAQDLDHYLFVVSPQNKENDDNGDWQGSF